MEQRRQGKEWGKAKIGSGRADMLVPLAWGKSWKPDSFWSCPWVKFCAEWHRSSPPPPSLSCAKAGPGESPSAATWVRTMWCRDWEAYSPHLVAYSLSFLHNTPLIWWVGESKGGGGSCSVLLSDSGDRMDSEIEYLSHRECFWLSSNNRR